MVNTPAGRLRLYDSSMGQDTNLPCILITPDGPNVIEHYSDLISLLSPHVRVVCFEMPGFGHSLPQKTYAHSLDEGAGVIVCVLDALGIQQATLAFSCVNGYYALRAAQITPERILQLVLSQTSSLRAIHPRARRNVPWPILLPVAGQILMLLFRSKVARDWYHVALPRNTDSTFYVNTALASLNHGGCFCLAGVAQGLGGEPVDTLNGIAVPCTLLWGTKDHSHKYTEPASLVECAPNAEVIRFEDTGHFPDIEQPKRYAEILLGKVCQASTASPKYATEDRAA
jgi:pimeloyl-ACP methyl ester carboxylesterase